MMAWSNCVLPATITITVLCLISGALSQVTDVEQVTSAGMCQTEYLEQPPDQLTCNPYPNAELRLECIVSMSTSGSLSGRLSVDWFHRPMLPDTTETATTDDQLSINRLADSAQGDITIREQRREVTGGSLQVRSRLEVRGLDQSDVGQYWCGIRIDSEKWTILSDPLLLEEPEEYVGLGTCSMTTGQSKRERKCAMWSFKPQQPTDATTDSVNMDTTTSLSTPNGPQEELGTQTEPRVPLSMSNTEDVDVLTDDGTTTELPEESTGSGPLIYIAVGILVGFGIVIIGLFVLVLCMCVKYRKMQKGKLDGSEQKGPRVIVQSPSTTATATDYLVPISTLEQRQVAQVQPMTGDNPVYMSDLRQEFTTFWLRDHHHQQQQLPQHQVASQQGPQEHVPRRSALEHSYETMGHDYEDIFLESLNSISGGSHNPVLMKSNEAYTIPRSLNFNIHPHMLPH